MSPSRREVLAGLLGSAGVAALGGCTSGVTAVPADGTTRVREAGRTVAITSGSFDSHYRPGRTGWSIIRPVGDARLPVLVALHGRGDDHLGVLRLGLDRALAGVLAAGVPPFAVASVDGGDHAYWHPRRAGDPAGMVLHEFLPLLHRRGLDVRRIGLFGWSMGGYGALYLGTVLGARRVSALVAESPAIWHEAGESAAGAFDDAADFDRHAIFGRLAALRGIPLRLDCGASDGFAPVTRDLRAALRPTPAGGIEPGGHDGAYWRRMAPAQLSFAGHHLRP